jgi:hypothetical protein
MDLELDYKYSMPLDSNFGDRIFHSKVIWKTEFAWLPHRCQLSRKIVWLETAVRGTAIYTGPGEPVIEYRWHNSQEHLIWLLKK